MRGSPREEGDAAPRIARQSRPRSATSELTAFSRLAAAIAVIVVVKGLKAALIQSLPLVLANGLYAARAITEERHLARDPVYREYQAYIRKHGIFACLRRLVPRAKLQSGESA